MMELMILSPLFLYKMGTFKGGKSVEYDVCLIGKIDNK